MRRAPRLALVAALVAAGCHAHPTGTVRFTPHTEDTRVGPVGTGNAACELYVYAWAHDGCTVQVNHCSREGLFGLQTVCMSLADERHVACGGHLSACGQDAECVCPTGAAPPVLDAPGTVHAMPTSVGQAVASADGKCRATVSTLPGGAHGPPPAPCIFAVHDCSEGACNDTTLMFDCGARDTVCGVPVKCDCP